MIVPFTLPPHALAPCIAQPSPDQKYRGKRQLQPWPTNQIQEEARFEFGENVHSNFRDNKSHTDNSWSRPAVGRYVFELLLTCNRDLRS